MVDIELKETIIFLLNFMQIYISYIFFLLLQLFSILLEDFVQDIFNSFANYLSTQRISPKNPVKPLKARQTSCKSAIIR